MKNNNEKFTQIPNSIMSNKHLTDQDKLTLGLILSWFKNNKECFMGNDYIAERMGISKNAASKRIKQLEKIGCIKLRYTYKELTKEVDKRYITLLSLTPKVSPTELEVSPTELEGIVHETKGYSPTDDGVSPKVGGIKQPLLDNVLNNVLDKLPNKELNKENSVELTKFEVDNLLLTLDNVNAPDRVLSLVKTLITDGPGYLTKNNRELVVQHKNYFKGKVFEKVLQQLF
jgi:DNA-binding Lrp family transcriptional regulator